MKFYTTIVFAVVSAASIGCTAEVQTTDDSHKVEVEVPKLEVGDEPADVDPQTDEDIDIDTPSPGDT